MFKCQSEQARGLETVEGTYTIGLLRKTPFIVVYWFVCLFFDTGTLQLKAGLNLLELRMTVNL